MKLYSQAYSNTHVTLQELNDAKTALINLDGHRLQALIEREAHKSASKGINQLKAALGLKPSTPVAIRALSDLYQTHNAQGEADSVPPRFAAHNAWHAARLFAAERAQPSRPPSPQERRVSRQGSISSTKSLQFSDCSEEITAGPWRMHAKRSAQLVSPAVLVSDRRAAFLAQAQERHQAKRAAADGLKSFENLKFVI